MSLFVVCEGLDGAGKTSSIKKVLEKHKEFVYSKGIGSKTFFGKMARRFPSTFMFLIELIYITFRSIKPNLGRNKIVLQDRYDFSVITFVPLANRWYNLIIRKIFCSFLEKPDALVYFSVLLGERIKRLRKEEDNKYHILLAENPNLIKIREKEYLNHYNGFNGKKIIIDTTDKSKEKCGEILEKFVLNLRR